MTESTNKNMVSTLKILLEALQYTVSHMVKQEVSKQVSQAMDLEHRYIDKKEAAEYASVSESTIDNYRRAGKIRSKKIGKKVLFYLPDLRDDLRSA